MFAFLGRYTRMVGKLCVDHKLESCYCIHGDASRIAGNIWYGLIGLCHHYMMKMIDLYE